MCQTVIHHEGCSTINNKMQEKERKCFFKKLWGPLNKWNTFEIVQLVLIVYAKLGFLEYKWRLFFLSFVIL